MNAIKNITVGHTERLRKPVGFTMLANLVNIVPFCLSIEAVNVIFRACDGSGTPLDTARLWTIFGILAVYMAAMALAERAAYRANFRGAYEMSAEGRISLAEHLRKLSLGFLSRRDPGDLSSMLITDFTMAETGISHHLPQLMGAMVMPVLAFLTLLWIDWRMATAMFVALPLAIGILLASTRIQQKLSSHQIAAKIEAGNRLEEYLQGIRVMKAYNMVGGRFVRLREAFAQLRRACIRQEALLGPFVLLSITVVRAGLTLMVLCFVPFIVIFTVIFRKFSRRAYRKVKDATTDINTYLSENLSGIKVTQIFGREDEKMAEFYQKSQTLSKVTQEQIFVFGVFRPLVYMLYISSILCLFYLGGMGHLNNVSFLGQTITGGTIVTFYMYISKFFTPIQNLAEQFNWLQSALASSEKVFSIMDIQPKLVDAPDAIELTDVKGEIEFRDVWFSYIPGEWVLQGVSFHVSPRETVAFVGSTGSGKSTILSLICRNYEFQKGEILIDGIDIRKIKISSLRRHFGQMLQDVFLFSGTIRSNIVLREDNISDEEIMQVCRYVNADHFINKLDHGLDEEVRERGNNFSAGQRQLLSFARTIIHKPSVMILDEATANIDTETELLIQDSLEKMRTVGTMLIVAHRLSTIQHADNIIVLSHGKILEQGSHQELLARHGRYYQLYTLQYHKEQLSS